MSDVYVSFVNGVNPVLTVNSYGVTRSFTKGDADYDDVVELARAKDYDGLKEYLKPQQKAQAIADNSNGLFEYNEGHLTVGGVSVPAQLSEKILGAHELGLEDVVLGLVNFFRRVNNNPSYDSVQRLFACLEVNNHPITPDGYFKAYKKVKRLPDGNLVDIYSGKFNNNIGAEPSVPRNQVDDNHNNTCSSGLHVASFDYAARHYGSQTQPLLEVLVDPADVVSVPTDYNSQKMRVCKYKVVKEVTEEDLRAFAPELANLYDSGHSIDVDDEDWDEDDKDYTWAIDEGYDAYYAGESRYANPYNGDEYDAWKTGWLNAKDEDVE